MPAIAELLQEGRYRIDQSAAPHGSRSVFLAYDTVSETSVVVKEIVVRLNKVTTLSQQETMKLAFTNKATALTEIRHPSLLQVQNFFTEVGRQFLVFENVDGDDFQTLLEKNQRPFAVEDVIAWADQLLDGLNYLHNFRPALIHKCINPGNIKLTLDGRVKLLSHGISDETGSTLTASITDSTEGGPLNYSPLELIWESLDAASQKVIVNSYDDRSERTLKAAPDARSDIYSLGATLYYLLTAKVPVDPLERSIELLEGNKDPLEVPHSVDPRIAPEVSDVVMRAMEIKRENRFDSATIMRQVLRTAVVRIKEREASETEEMQEASEFLRNTQQLRTQPMPEPPAAVEPPPPSQPLQSAQPETASLLEQKLREAEELRRLAEQRAAEAERMLREQESERLRLASVAKAENVVPAPVRETPEDDLLGLNLTPVSLHASTPPAFEPVMAAQPHLEREVRAFFDDTSEKPSIETPVHEDVSEPAPEVVENHEAAFKPPVEDHFEAESERLTAEEHYPTESTEPDESFDTATESVYNYEENHPKSGLPIPMIAGAAAVLLLVVIGGWMFLGSSSNDAPSAQPTQTIVAPVETAPQVSEPPVVTQEAVVPETQTDQNNFAVQTDAEPETTKPAAKTAPAKTPKPAAPAKTPAPKKPVTVDDLISDN